MATTIRKIKNTLISYADGSEQLYVFRIYSDEDNKVLRISLTALDEIYKPGEYYLTINGSSTKTYFSSYVQEDSNCLYNVTISLSEFREQDNVIQFFVPTITEDGTISTILGDIKFFGEVELSSLNVKLDRPGNEETPDQALWTYIKQFRLNFTSYRNFINDLMCSDTTSDGSTFTRASYRENSPFIGIDAYNVIKFATQAYMLRVFGISGSGLSGYLSSAGNLPYYQRVIDALDDYFVDDSACSPLYNRNPFMIELIWNFWMEQGMLVETMKLISMRFRNYRGSRRVDLLQRFDTDPLRPLNHILWGYTQDSQHRLLSEQRAHEYLHAYGLLTLGENMGNIMPADSRSKFLDAFHNLLNCCCIYFKEADDTTRIADAFPVLNSLKEVHLLLAEGNHNAYGGLTWTARHEMLIQQYILSRTEMREFIGGKVMVPYNEPWMDRVDTMRNIQGWGGTSITNFYELAVYGEQILLSIRLGDWSDVALTSANAANWALGFRDAIQRYIHSLRVATGIDLSVDQVQTLPRLATQPALLIQERARPQPAPQAQRGYIPLNRY